MSVCVMSDVYVLSSFLPPLVSSGGDRRERKKRRRRGGVGNKQVGRGRRLLLGKSCVRVFGAVNRAGT